MSTRTYIYAFFVLLVSLLAAPYLFVEAATHIVTVSADSGPGSLRDTLQNAASGDTISFDSTLSGTTIVLASDLPIITKTLTIDGRTAPNLTISGNNLYSSGFAVEENGDLTIVGLTFANGFLPADIGGGAFYVAGKLSIQDSTLRDNKAGYGGAIFNDGGELLIINSTITNNEATEPSAFGGGGAIDQFFNGTTEIQYSTITQNGAANSARAGLWIESGTLTMTASILEHATSSCALEAGGTLVSGGYNVDYHVSGAANACGLASVGDEIFRDPMLAALADNGGASWTQASTVNGAAIDRVPHGQANCGTTITVDQRGIPRLGACDSGAYELLPGAPTISFATTAVSVTESTGFIDLVVVLDTATTIPMTVTWTTIDGTALAGAGEDYTSTGGQLLIAAGQTSAAFPISIIDDAVEESSEDFSVRLSNPSWGELSASPETTVTILDDDLAQSNEHKIYLPVIVK